MRRGPSRYPRHLERQLAARLRRRARVVRAVVLEQLHALQRHDSQRADSVFGASAMGPRIRLAVRSSLPIPPSSLVKTARGIDASVTAGVGADLGEPTTDLGPNATRAATDAWTRETATRIAEAEDAAITRALTAADEAADAGEDPVAAAREALVSAETRAALLATDAVGNLAAEVTQTRAQQLGSTAYVWRTQKDERVRPAHHEREGDTFRWDSPPEDGAPSEAPMCRCWAQPIPGE